IEEKRLLHMSLGNIKSYEHYDKLLPELYKKQIYDREATQLHGKTITAMQLRVSDRSNFLKDFQRILLRMEELWTISSSSVIFHKFHMLRILYLEQNGNYTEIVKVIANAEQLLFQKAINPHWFNKRFNSYVYVYALLQSRQYEQGLKLANEYLSLFREYSTNWFGFMENFVLLAMHSKNYAKAAQLLLKATVGSQFEKLPGSSRERWELYRRFFLFMHSACSNARLYKVPPEVSNNLILLPKDKAGFNLSLLVLEILEGLAEGKFEDLELQADRVRKYTAKYLKGEKAERPRLFMRMLQLALKGKNMDVVHQQGSKMLQKLQETPLPGDAFAEVEIVPYEHLWEVALHLLEKQKA
ncbi:MAG: hypothetical protein LPK03_02545, partial [Pontibacter sp.]|nr:hypothetical protein [Pontibacter sp.]